jgi:hypothetical protein
MPCSDDRREDLLSQALSDDADHGELVVPSSIFFIGLFVCLGLRKNPKFPTDEARVIGEAAFASTVSFEGGLLSKCWELHLDCRGEESLVNVTGGSFLKD